MKLLWSLLVTLTIAMPRSAVGLHDRDPASSVGYVVPKDTNGGTMPFVNEVAGDASSVVNQITAPTPTPTPRKHTRKPSRSPKPITVTPSPSSNATDNYTPTPSENYTPTPTPSNSTNTTIPLNGTSGSHVQYAIRSGRLPSQGVNLGGWLVAEHWMNAESDIWKGLTDDQANSGEQTAFKNTEYNTAVQRFKQHRDTFITEDEIAAIARAGLNTVRVPVGYWIVGFDKHDTADANQWKNYAPGGLDFLDALIRNWAKKYNLAVLISMHGAKGSQNGADHSSPEQASKSLWSEYPENYASTLDAVVFLADRYKNEDAFLGIGLMNEPGGTTSNTQLYKYYEDAYQAIRNEGHNDCILTIAPLLWEQSANFMTGLLPGATNVWVEWHRYFVWGFEDTSEEDLLGKSMTQYRDDVDAWKHRSDKKLFIGEFSFATAGKFQDPAKLKQFGQNQLEILRQTVNGGWTFWSWRVYGDENGVNPWSLRNLLRNGIFPSLSTSQQS